MEILCPLNLKPSCQTERQAFSSLKGFLGQLREGDVGRRLGGGVAVSPGALSEACDLSYSVNIASKPGLQPLPWRSQWPVGPLVA
jgi:hypothetical protein